MQDFLFVDKPKTLHRIAIHLLVFIVAASSFLVIMMSISGCNTMNEKYGVTCSLGGFDCVSKKDLLKVDERGTLEVSPIDSIGDTNLYFATKVMDHQLAQPVVTSLRSLSGDGSFVEILYEFPRNTPYVLGASLCVNGVIYLVLAIPDHLGSITYSIDRIHKGVLSNIFEGSVENLMSLPNLHHCSDTGLLLFIANGRLHSFQEGNEQIVKEIELHGIGEFLSNSLQCNHLGFYVAKYTYESRDFVFISNEKRVRTMEIDVTDGIVFVLNNAIVIQNKETLELKIINELTEKEISIYTCGLLLDVKILSEDTFFYTSYEILDETKNLFHFATLDDDHEILYGWDLPYSGVDLLYPTRFAEGKVALTNTDYSEPGIIPLIIIDLSTIVTK